MYVYLILAEAGDEIEIYKTRYGRDVFAVI